MADEQVGVEGAAAPSTPGEAIVEIQEPADQEAGTPSIPKPRFDEVLNRAKASEQKNRELEARIQSLEVRPVAPAQPERQIPTLEQILSYYERGQITESLKDQWVVYHTKEAAKQEVGQAVTQAVGMAKASATTADYLKSYPTLTDASSQEFQSLSATYNELLSEGYPNNVSTQSKALRMTFGPVRAAQGKDPGEHTRQRADTFLEGAGGGRVSSDTDVLKEVSPKQTQFWKQKGYTKGQMSEEAKFKGVGNISDYRRMAKKKA